MLRVTPRYAYATNRTPENLAGTTKGVNNPIEPANKGMFLSSKLSHLERMAFVHRPDTEAMAGANVRQDATHRV